MAREEAMNLHHITEDPGGAPGYCTEYGRPDCRCTSTSLPRWIAATFDEIDYGMLLLDRGARVLHINHAALVEIDDEDHPLQMLAGELKARRVHDVAPLHDALQSAALHGKRKLLTLGEGTRRVSLAVVPLVALDRDESAATLVTLGKRQLCSTLSVHGYARAHGLTPAETQVLQALSEGADPTEIAVRQGVELSTVRTQISSMRAKTGADSIRALERQVAALPPLVGALRMMRSFVEH
jgi:DNA-binding CsgD family transcriptional regulator